MSMSVVLLLYLAIWATISLNTLHFTYMCINFPVVLLETQLSLTNRAMHCANATVWLG